jgi:hypothetical protein
MRMIDKVVELNKAAGGTFFDRRTILYFKNKVLPTLYGDKYFISYDLSEDEGKRYTVRVVLNGGLIGKVGELHAYATQSAARLAIRELMGDAVTA